MNRLFAFVLAQTVAIDVPIPPILGWGAAVLFGFVITLVAHRIIAIERRVSLLETLPERVARLEERTSSSVEGRKR